MKKTLIILASYLCISTALATTATYVGDDANGDLDGMIQLSNTNAPLSRTASGDDGVPVTELDGNGKNWQTLLYLDFIGEGANQVPAGSSVSSAELQLWYSNDNGNKDITVYRLTKSFDTATTWGNYGAIGDSGADSRVVKFGGDKPVKVTVDVTDAVQSWVSGASANHGWGFSEEDSNGCEWTSVFADGGGNSSNSINPTLVVEYDDGSVAIITDLSAVNVSEGSTSTFDVKLSLPPTASVTVNTARVSGDTDISVTHGADLTFTTNNWSIYQTVTLSAAEDTDWVNDSATIRCSSFEMPDVDITATELDNDTDPSLLLPFSEPFENSGENPVTNGVLNGQHGWTGGGTVQGGTVYEGTQALELTSDTASRSFDGSPTNVVITLWIDPVAGGQPSGLPSDASAIFYVSTNNNQLVAYSNTTPIEISGAIVSNGWNKIVIECDYVSKVWNLKLNDTPQVENFPFHGSPTHFQTLEITENSAETLFVDSISISSASGGSDPEDTDDDGLPDSWENQFGGLSLDPDAAAANGVNTVMETYIAGLNPTNSSVLEVSNTRNNLQWTSVSGRVYTVYWTSNLLNDFEIVESNLTSGTFTDTEHQNGEKGFYKIDVKLD